MKVFLKKIIIVLLRWEARAVLQKFRPRIVAVTGSIGKSSTKEAIACILGSKYFVRQNPKSYNSEFGIPLTILGLSTPWNSTGGWIMVLLRGFFARFRKEYPHILVLEAGVDRPGDMDTALSFMEPQISVVTALGEIPVHVEFFPGPKELAFEKSKLVRRTLAGGAVILNADDPMVYEMRREARGKIITFGFGKEADIRMSHYALVTNQTGAGTEIPGGIRCKVDYQGSSVPLRMESVYGKQQLYIAAAAIAVSIQFEFTVLTAVEALVNYQPLAGRLRLLEGIKDSFILDDTYNASPTAMHAALDALRDMPARRRIAVLGDMLEIGKFTIPAHQQIGELAVGIADILISVGPRAKFIGRQAHESGMNESVIHECGNSRDAGVFGQSLLEPGDVVLVKGSQSMRMERTVEEIMAHPEQASELLCRQEEYWKNKV
ncbi:MAG: UDP-N-acetylmuramoyl-tripeptide--D-alanyl-D-alanine ligase [Patescibacteria group bacterium]